MDVGPFPSALQKLKDTGTLEQQSCGSEDVFFKSLLFMFIMCAWRKEVRPASKHILGTKKLSITSVRYQPQISPKKMLIAKMQ